MKDVWKDHVETYYLKSQLKTWLEGIVGHTIWKKMGGEYIDYSCMWMGTGR